MCGIIKPVNELCCVNKQAHVHFDIFSLIAWWQNYVHVQTLVCIII